MIVAVTRVQYEMYTILYAICSLDERKKKHPLIEKISSGYRITVTIRLMGTGLVVVCMLHYKTRVSHSDFISMRRFGPRIVLQI